MNAYSLPTVKAVYFMRQHARRIVLPRNKRQLEREAWLDWKKKAQANKRGTRRCRVCENCVLREECEKTSGYNKIVAGAGCGLRKGR